MLLHVSILRSSSGSTYCSLLTLHVKIVNMSLHLLVMWQHIVCLCMRCFQCSGVCRLATFRVGDRKQRIDLELWYDRFPKSFLHSSWFHVHPWCAWTTDVTIIIHVRSAIFERSAPLSDMLHSYVFRHHHTPLSIAVNLTEGKCFAHKKRNHAINFFGEPSCHCPCSYTSTNPRWSI